MSGVLSRVLAAAFGACALTLASGCTQQAQTVTLRSLESSGTFSFVCLGAGLGARNLDDCPDNDPVDGEDRHLVALVTQATRGEVALVDLTTGDVIDDEPTIPGFNFLPVGAEPRAIVSTPGSVATFVGVTEVGKEGIFALPTSCLRPRAAGERMRDLTMWPACSLPSPPGEMAVLVDHPVDGDRDPATPPAPQCVSSFPTATSEEIESRECPADLSLETESPGRRLLAVTLPASGELAVIDAQALLDRPPGSFDPCPIQMITKLRVDLPAEPPKQVLPPDLDLPGAVLPVGVHRESLDYETRPSGLALVDDPRTGEERLYIGDQAAPVIHVLEANNPCALEEKEPLLPVSFLDPGRTVTTKRLAASPLTTEGKRFLYAIDERGDGNAMGSVMAFDVSPGATDRTPLLRPRSAYLAAEPPDRIVFPAPANDVTFALRDRVEEEITGSQQVGILCDPDPALDPNAPPARHRTSADFTQGARPGLLRGVFGFVALTSGAIAVVDVEDFDAKCRRPAAVNSSSTPDFRGCSGDPAVESYSGTVSQELSCNTVERHRPRSALFVLNDADFTGDGTPSLRAIPRLLSDTGRTLPSDVSKEGRKNPKMLAVDFGPEDPAQVYVGTTLFEQGSIENPLSIDPTQAEQHSLVFDMTEPRSYPPSEQFSAIYEGPLFNERPFARFVFDDGQASLVDSGVVLCNVGVEDQSVAAERGRSLGVPEGEALDTFSRTHGDYIRITSDLLEESDAYWSSGAGSRCGGADPSVPGAGFLQCRTQLGTRKAMRAEREFAVTEAYSAQLKLTPRNGDAELSTFVACCFPQAVSYEVRASNAWVVRGSASGYRHDVTFNPVEPYRCEIDKNPQRSRQRGRVYEVTCAADSEACAEAGEDEEGNPRPVPTSIGLAGPNDVACVVRSPTEITKVNDSPCVFHGLSSIFVIYRGQEESVRDWAFSWEIGGGFSPLFFNLATSSDPNSNPQTMVYSNQLKQLVIADGASKGLVTIDLGTFASQFYY